MRIKEEEVVKIKKVEKRCRERKWRNWNQMEWETGEIKRAEGELDWQSVEDNWNEKL